MPTAVTMTPGPRATTRRLVASLAAVALFAMSCTSEDDGDTATTEQAASTGTEPAASTTTVVEDLPPTEAPAEVPALSGLDGAIGEASDLVLSWFNGATFDRAVYEAAFDPIFREAVGFEQVTPIIDQIVIDAPFEVQEVQEASPTSAQLSIVGSSGSSFELSVVVAGVDDPTMTGVFVGPPRPPFEAPTSVDDAVSRLEALGTLRVGSFSSDCRAGELAIGADTQAPIGSGFKLWVLAAVVDAVERGDLRWDDEVTIRDELDAHPSGITQDEPAGTLLTVRELADRMIAISDNTATNHLMDLLGRDQVEQTMVDSGHSAPERNLPLMDAREFTIVKFGDDDLRNRYAAADESERRRILDQEVASMELPSITAITSITDPLAVESVEWFASPADLCRTLTMLADDATAIEVLALSPGVPDEVGRWETILFKGGSEPGVIAMAWLTIDADGNSFVTAGGLANEEALIDDAEAANLFAYLRDTAPAG